MEKLSYENILTNITLHQIDSTSLHLLFQRNFTLLNVINYQDFLYGISLPDIHLDLVFINDVLICQTLCPITLILQLPRYHRKPFLGGTSNPRHLGTWTSRYLDISVLTWTSRYSVLDISVLTWTSRYSVLESSGLG